MEKLKQYKFQIIIGVLAILFIVWYNYNNNSYQRLKGKYSVLQAQYDAQKENVILLEQFRKKEKDSLNNAITFREKENAKLRLIEISLQDKINGIKKRVVKIPIDLKSSAGYYNTEYKTVENIVIEDKVGLALSTSTAIITDLENGKKCYEISILKDKQILSKDININNLEKDKKDLNTLVLSAEKQIEADKLLQKSADENISNLAKQNKKLKTKNFLNKVLVPVALVIGGIIGVQVAK